MDTRCMKKIGIKKRYRKKNIEKRYKQKKNT